MALPKKNYCFYGITFLQLEVSDKNIYIARQYIYGKVTSCAKAFGIPLVSSLCDVVNGYDICNLFLKLLNPFLIPIEAALDAHGNSEDSANGVTEMEDAGIPPVLSSGGNPADEMEDDPHCDTEFQFFLTDERGNIKDSKIEMNEPVPVTGLPRRLNVLVCWTGGKIKQYDPHLLSSLPEIFKSSSFAKRPQESVSLYACLEAFLKEEPLGPEDMW